MIDGDDCGEFVEWVSGKGNRNTRRKPAPVPRYPPQFANDLTPNRTPAAAVGSRWHQILLNVLVILQIFIQELEIQQGRRLSARNDLRALGRVFWNRQQLPPSKSAHAKHSWFVVNLWRQWTVFPRLMELPALSSVRAKCEQQFFRSTDCIIYNVSIVYHVARRSTYVIRRFGGTYHAGVFCSFLILKMIGSSERSIHTALSQKMATSTAAARTSQPYSPLRG
jgi:hypothetical protein